MEGSLITECIIFSDKEKLELLGKPYSIKSLTVFKAPLRRLLVYVLDLSHWLINSGGSFLKEFALCNENLPREIELTE